MLDNFTGTGETGVVGVPLHYYMNSHSRVFLEDCVMLDN